MTKTPQQAMDFITAGEDMAFWREFTLAMPYFPHEDAFIDWIKQNKRDCIRFTGRCFRLYQRVLEVFQETPALAEHPTFMQFFKTVDELAEKFTIGMDRAGVLLPLDFQIEFLGCVVISEEEQIAHGRSLD